MTAIPEHSLSVSIVSYHAPITELRSMLESLIAALEKLEPEPAYSRLSICLIDNSESHTLNLQEFVGYQERLNAINCELKLIQGQGNVGYGAAHNLAILNSDSKFHLLMNPDIELDASSLQQGLDFLQNNEEVAAVSPAARFENGEKQYLCKRYPSVLDFFLRGFMPGFVLSLFGSRLARFEMRELSEEHPTRDIPIISGCFMLCRTDALQAVGGFNGDYFLYFEDFDLSMRLARQASLAYLPAMKITHHGGNSSRKGLHHIRLFISSGRRFFSQYGWRWL